MKKLILFSLFAVATFSAQAQMKDPVSWKYEAVKKSGNVYEITITATIEKPWHIYSQNTGKGGPVPTSFAFSKNPLVTLEGKTKENGKLEKIFDKNFNTNVLYYSGTVTFVQTAKVKSTAKTSVSGKVEYMVCDDTQCLPPTKKSFDIKLQ
jgi:thiol:disulfide interchange protein DsbD